jgi:D-serine deaminase-like pyridoxal phosphate-dependent protein
VPQVVTRDELRAAGVQTYPPVSGRPGPIVSQQMGQLAAEKAAAEKRARDFVVFQDEQIKKLKAELAEARAAHADPTTGSSSSRVRSRQ